MTKQNPSLEDLLEKEDENLLAKNTPSTKQQLSQKLAQVKLAAKEEETKQEAGKAGLPYIDLAEFPISVEAVASIPQKIAQKLKVICFLNTGDEIRIAALEITDEVTEQAYQLGERFKANVKIYLISEKSFQVALSIYDRVPKVIKVEHGLKITEESLNKFQQNIKSTADIQSLIKETNITETIDLLVAAAIKTSSSDFHIEAEQADIKVRFRIDGILQDVAEIEKKQWKQLIDRIKLLAGLKINITTTPQDGRFTIKSKEEDTDVRVSTIPTTYGESVVMRLLMSSRMQIKLDALGMRAFDFKILEKEIKRPNGMILVTGPTGSGKTTTLYGVLKNLNQPGVKIITLEDPVEYRIEGINQSQINSAQEYSFASGLRSILRQDPDIVMVGEIRDLETAETAINAALTGHLLLSTVHTNSAAGAVPRLLSMNVKPFLLAPALNLIIAQRLVRVLCNHCKEKYTPSAEEIEKVKKIIRHMPDANPDKPKGELEFWTIRKNGCAECGNTGFKGRCGIFELIPATNEIKQLILAGQATELSIFESAQKNSATTMVQDGIIKTLTGITSLSEVFRVTQ